MPEIDVRTLNPAIDRQEKIKGPKRTEGLSWGSSIVVVGAGVMGGWTALYLQRAGFKVQLVDAWGPGNSRASSGGESRLIRAIYGSNEIYTQLTVRAFELWEQHQVNWPSPVQFPTGVLWFSYPGRDEILGPARAIINKHDLPYEEMSAAEAGKRYPMINCDDLDSVILETNAGYLKPSLACQYVREQFMQEGGSFVPLEAKPVYEASGNVEHLHTNSGDRISGDVFIFACGPWLKSLFPEVLGEGLTVTRQEIHYFGVPSRWSAYDQIPGWIDLNLDDNFYGIPGDLSRGFKLANDRRGAEFDPTNGERIPTEKEINAARAYLTHRFPELAKAPLNEARVCQYSNSRDGNIFIDQHPNHDNLWLMGGGSGHSFKYGPALGEYAAEIIQGKQDIPVLFQLLN